jgi:hypothetical protein
MNTAKRFSELDYKPRHVPFQVCPHCDNVFYGRREPFGPAGCGCKHDPKEGPQPGDAVTIVGNGSDYWELYKGSPGIIESLPEWAEGKAHICFSCYGAYRNPHLSLSGGPWACVPLDKLRHVGTKLISFWKWPWSGPGAHKGEHYTLEVQAWELAIEDLK